MFRPLLRSSSGGQIVLVQGLVSSLSLGDFNTQVNLRTEQSLKESEDTRCCTNTIWPPDDERNSARNM